MSATYLLRLRLMHILICASLLLCNLNAAARNVRDSLATSPRCEFVQNKGQWDHHVAFRAELQRATLFAEHNAFTIVVRRNIEIDPSKPSPLHHHAMPARRHAYRMTFAGCNDIVPQGLDAAKHYSNYYLSRNPEHWQHHVQHYAQVLYPNLYDGIDMRLYANQGSIKYDFVVSAGADANQIRMVYSGTDGLRLTSDGALCIRTSAVDIVETMPIVYQTSDKGRQNIEARYVVHDSSVTIQLGQYDRSLPLVIDPYLYFSSYTGSTADNWGTTATYDSHKNTYTAGLVFGDGYPYSLGAYDSLYADMTDIGIFKFDTSGTERLFATYMGGCYADMPHSLFVNAFDELVIFGTTGSPDFPVTDNAYDTSFNGGNALFYEFNGINYPNGSDIYVARFSEDGSRLEASTYVGGTNNDGLNFRQAYNSGSQLMFGTDSLYFNYGDGARGELIVDDQNNVYVGSTTFSSDFPISEGAIQDTNYGMQEGVVFKLDYNMRNMLWSTYLGGSSDDAVYSIEVDSDYNLLACGGTCSPDFPTTAGAYCTTYNGGTVDGFVCKISYHGDRLMACSFYGSNAYDQCYFVRTGRTSNVFLFGQTKASGSTLIHNAGYNVPNSGQFLAHLSPNLDSLVWGTVFGTGNGKPNISPTAFVADLCNRVYAVGWGRDFVGYYNNEHVPVLWNTFGTTGMEVTSDAYQGVTDGQDFYIMSMSMDASTLDYATFFGEVHTGNPYIFRGGSDHVDGGTSRFDRQGTLYQSVCGSCGGTSGFPTTPGAWSDSNLATNCNNAVFRFNIHRDFPLAEFSAVPVGCAPYEVTFNNTGRGTDFRWDFGDGSTSTLKNPTHTYAHGGEYTVTLKAHQSYGCAEWDSVKRVVRVIENNSRRLAAINRCNTAPVQIGFQPIPGCIYNWTHGSVTDASISNPYVNSTDTYILEIRQQDLLNDDGCVEVDTFDVTYYTLLDSVIVLAPECDYDSFGTATAVINPLAQGEITYLWDGDSSTSNTFGPVLNSPLTHTLRVSNGECAVDEYFTIFTPAPTKQKTANTVLCSGCDGKISIEMTDSHNNTYSYLWDNGSTNNQIDSLCEGTYSVVITNSNLCTYYDTTIVVRSTTFQGMRVWADDSIVTEGSYTILHATEKTNCTYTWSPDKHLTNPTHNETKARMYQNTMFRLTVTDKDGCIYYDSVPVGCDIVNCGKESLFIPNAFSPNGDGLNDRLCMRYEEPITEFYIAIFTRWGELLYESHSVDECWDGTYHGNECLPGVYMYTCRVTCIEGKESEFKGDITLIR